MADRFSESPVTLTAPAVGGEAVTPSDETDLGNVSRSLYVGTAGNISMVMKDGTTLLLANVPVGFHPLRVQRVNSDGTTASDMVALY